MRHHGACDLTPELIEDRRSSARSHEVSDVHVDVEPRTHRAGLLTGSALAASATVAVAIANDWSAVLDLAVLGAGPIVGALAGIVSAAYPALRATTIEPAQAVRTT